MHFNTKYPDILAAIDKEDGLMVMGFFIQVYFPLKFFGAARLKTFYFQVCSLQKAALVRNEQVNKIAKK